MVSFYGNGGGPLNFHPPNQGNLTIGEIPIPIIQGEFPVSTSMDRKPGQCFPKTLAIPSMLVKSAHIREQIQFMLEHALIGKFIGLQPL